MQSFSPANNATEDSISESSVFFAQNIPTSLEIWMVLWYNTHATQLNRYHSRRTFGKNVRSVNHACYDKLCRNRTVLHFSVRSCWGALFIFTPINLIQHHNLTQGLPKKCPPWKGDTGGCCVGTSVFHPPSPPLKGGAWCRATLVC